MSDFKVLSEAISKGDMQTAASETQKALDASVPAQEILDNGLIAAMDEVGDKYAKGQSPGDHRKRITSSIKRKGPGQNMTTPQYWRNVLNIEPRTRKGFATRRESNTATARTIMGKRKNPKPHNNQQTGSSYRWLYPA